MKLNEQVDYIMRDIKRQSERLEIYRMAEKLLAGVSILEDHNIYAHKYDGDGVNTHREFYCEFSPGYSDEANKDLRPLVHRLARRFHVKFHKHDTDGTVEYLTEIGDITHKIDDEDWLIRFRVSGVIPGTCHVEENEIPLSDEEIEANRQEALAKVKTTRIERKVVCK